MAVVAPVIRLVDIIDSAGIATHYGITRQVLSNWKTRTDFPAPLDTPMCEGNPIYDFNVVEAWIKANTVESRTLILRST